MYTGDFQINKGAIFLEEFLGDLQIIDKLMPVARQ